MLTVSQVRPELRADIERLQRDSHNHRDETLYALCVQTLRRAAALRDDAAFVLAAQAFAVVMDQHGHDDEGLGLLAEALERARAAHWFDEQAELLVLMGRAYYGRADYLAALELWTEALDVAQRAGNTLLWGWGKLGIGQICDALDSPSLALAVFGELQQVLATLPAPAPDAARLGKLRLYNHLNLGVNHRRLGRFDEALQHYRVGLQLAQQLDIRDEQGEALFRIAEIHDLQGRADEALRDLDEAQRICSDCSFFWALANIRLLRAELLARAGDLPGALRETEHALIDARHAGARHIEARILRRRSALAESAGDPALALAALRHAVQLHQEIDGPSQSKTLHDLEDLAGIRVSPDRKLLMLSGHPLLDGSDWPRIVALLCDEGRAALDVERVVYWAVEADALRAQQASGGHLPAEDLTAATAPELLQRLRAGHSVLAHNARHHQETWALQTHYLAPHDVQALLAYPVQLAGATVGVFFFEQIGRRRNWNRAAVLLANQLAMIAARSLSQIDRQRDQGHIRSLNEALRQANQDLELRVERRTSELRAAMKALETSRAEAERNARAKGEFLAHMSHEIRTPLNGVLGMAQVGLQQSRGHAVGPEVFSRIIDSGQLLLGIINDILDFSKIDAGMVSIDALPMDLHQVLERSIQLVAERAQLKAVALAVELDPQLPRWCRSDALRVGQILLNLLSNALKFTEAGHVTLHAAPAGAWLVLRVSDTGIGITPEQIERIFSPFQQADSSTTREFGGTGLGLTITRRLVDLMGGHIEVQSEPGAGSHFTVRLPLVELGAPAPHDAPPAAHAARSLAGCSVLVAEDNEVNQIVVEGMLALAGVAVTLVGNGRLAVEHVRAHPTRFDAVLMDVQMPEMDGYEATRHLRVLAPKLPVIGLTAHAMAEDRALCLQAGMIDHVAKPVATEALLDALRRHVATR